MKSADTQLPYTVEAAANAFFAMASVSMGSSLLTTGNANLLMYGMTPAKRRVRPERIFRPVFGNQRLSEPQAGSYIERHHHGPCPDGVDFEADLGALSPQGQQDVISAGEHELDSPENIIHLVLAKIPGPDGKLIAGTKGISLFIVPKKMVEWPRATGPAFATTWRWPA